MARLKIGDLMIKAGLIDEMQLQSALAHQRRWGGLLGDILVDLGFLDEEMLWRGLSKQLGVPVVTLRDHKHDAATLSALPLSIAEEHGVFPLSATDREIRLATSDPGDLAAQDEIGFKTNRRVSIVLAPASHIAWAIDRHYRRLDRDCPPFKKRRVLPSEEGPPIQDEDWNGPETKGGSTHPSLSTIPRPAPTMAEPDTSGPALPRLGYSAPPSRASTPLDALTAAQSHASASHEQVQRLRSGAVSMLEITRVETELRQTTRFIRLVVDTCVNRGLFTREEYLAKVRSS